MRHETVCIPAGYGRTPEIVTFSGHALDLRGQIARELVERWGTVAGERDGEDSAGRARIRLMTPAELATRACDTAELLVDEMNRRGFLVAVPLPSEVDWAKVAADAKVDEDIVNEARRTHTANR